MYDSEKIRAAAEAVIKARCTDAAPYTEYFAACDSYDAEVTPETVLALLDEIEALRHDIERHIANHAADLNAIVSDREKFEAWAKSEEYDLRPPLYDKDRAYVSPMTNAVWIGWQAARAAIDAARTQGGAA